MAKGFGNIMKQAQKLQSQMAAMQEDLEKERVTGSAGGGMVTASANGKQELLEVKIDPQVVDADDVEMLEDLVLAAVNQAREKAQQLAGEKMQGMTGGMDIPGLPM